MKILFRGGRVVDPSQGLDGHRDILVEDGRIAALLEPGTAAAADETVGLGGQVVAPGFVDLHARLGEPGFEYRETVASGLAAAAAGGYTTVACSPHTEPVLDEPTVLAYVLGAAARCGLARVAPLAAATRKLAGAQLADYGLLSAAGAVAFSNGQRALGDAAVLRLALLHAQHTGRRILVRPEDVGLAGKGVVHEGEESALLGLAGILSSAEAAALARDVMVLEETGGRYHAATLSAARSLEVLRSAQARGLDVTADVGIAHLVLDHSVVRTSGFSTATKFQPPLRSLVDRDALRVGVADGTIVAISSHHVPLHADEKLTSFTEAPFGAVGLETTVALGLTELVRTGVVTLSRFVELLSVGPARLLGLSDAGSLAVGRTADLTVLDLEARWTVEPAKLRSRSRNTPFGGRELVGRAVATYLAGRRVALPD